MTEPCVRCGRSIGHSARCAAAAKLEGCLPTLRELQRALGQVGNGSYWLTQADYQAGIDRVAVDRAGQRALLYAQRIGATPEQLQDALLYGRKCALDGRVPSTAGYQADAWLATVRTPGVTL